MPEDGKAKLEFMLGKNVEDFMLHFFENGDLENLFRDFWACYEINTSIFSDHTRDYEYDNNQNSKIWKKNKLSRAEMIAVLKNLQLSSLSSNNFSSKFLDLSY